MSTLSRYLALLVLLAMAVAADAASVARHEALASDSLDQTGFILKWLVVGPFPNPGGRTNWREPVPLDINQREVNFHADFLSSVGGEAGVRPAPGGEVARPGAEGVRFRWQPIAADPANGIVDIAGFYAKQGAPVQQVLCYLTCCLESDGERRVVLSLGSDDGYKLWINGEFVIDHHTHRGVVIDDDPVPIQLRRGTNLVLLKVATDTGGWAAAARVVDKGFEPVSGVELVIPAGN